MKILRFQKRRYGTAPTVIGQHTERAEIDIPVLSTRIFENENAKIDNLVDESGSEGLPSDESDKHTNEFLFKTGEVAVFRGTDGRSFNLLRVSKDYKYNITQRTRNQGDFLIEHDSLDNDSIEFREDTQWKAVSMNFALILRDADDQIVTVSLEERKYLTRTVYLMDGEIYKELQSLSDEFEESIKRPAENARQDSENDPFCT